MTDEPGTCHQVGCPTKGTKDEHVPTAGGLPIGAGTWEDYQRETPPSWCLGYPVAIASGTKIAVLCSITPGGWGAWLSNLDPKAMAALVDDHRERCTNRSPR